MGWWLSRIHAVAEPRTYLDSSVLIHAVLGVSASATAMLLADPQREFVAATLLKLELLPQPTFHHRPAELAFHRAFFERVKEWVPASEELLAQALHEAGLVPLSAMDAWHVAAARRLGAAEFITSEKPSKPLYKVKGLKVTALASL